MHLGVLDENESQLQKTHPSQNSIVIIFLDFFRFKHFSDSFNRTVVSDTVNIGEFSFCRFGQDGIQNLVGNYRRFGKKIWLTECLGAQRSSGFPCKHGLYSKLLRFSGNPANHPKMLKEYGSTMTIPMNRCRGLSHQQ